MSCVPDSLSEFRRDRLRPIVGGRQSSLIVMHGLEKNGKSRGEIGGRSRRSLGVSADRMLCNATLSEVCAFVRDD